MRRAVFLLCLSFVGATCPAPRTTLYAVGGLDSDGNPSPMVEMFDATSTEGYAKPYGLIDKLSLPRQWTASVAVNGRFYVIGGLNGKDPLDVVEYYDITGQKWGLGAPLKQPRFAAAAILSNSRLWVVGGAIDYSTAVGESEYYDLESKDMMWSPIAVSMNDPRAGIGLALFSDPTTKHSLLFAIGGFTGNKVFLTIEVLDLDDLAGWSYWGGPNLPEPRCFHTTVTFKDVVIVIGGARDLLDPLPQLPMPVNSVFVFQDMVGALASSLWVEGPPLIQARQGHSSVLMNGIVYVAGGLDDKQLVLSSIEYINVRDLIECTGKWRAGAEKLTVPRGYFSLGGVRDVIAEVNVNAALAVQATKPSLPITTNVTYSFSLITTDPLAFLIPARTSTVPNGVNSYEMTFNGFATLPSVLSLNVLTPSFRATFSVLQAYTGPVNFIWCGKTQQNILFVAANETPALCSNITTSSLTFAGDCSHAEIIPPRPPTPGIRDVIIDPIMVSPKITIFSYDNETNTSIYAFTLPIDEAVRTSAYDRIESNGCAQPSLRCEWQDPASLLWSDSGCVSIEVPEGLRCVCNHLTVFAAILRADRNMRPMCNAHVGDYSLIAIYGIMFLAITLPLCRLAVAKGLSYLSKPLPLQLGMLWIACVFRVLFMALKGGLGEPGWPSAALLLLSLLASWSVLSLFLYLTATWSSIRLYSLQPSPFSKLRTPFLGVISVLLLICVTLVILVGVLEDPLVAVSGSYVLSAISGLACLFFFSSGTCLAHSLTTTSKSVTTTSSLTKRITRASLCLSLCLLAQAVLWAVAVSVGVLNSDNATVATDVLFYFFDLLAILGLLILLSPGVRKVIQGTKLTTSSVDNRCTENRAPASSMLKANNQPVLHRDSEQGDRGEDGSTVKKPARGKSLEQLSTTEREETDGETEPNPSKPLRPPRQPTRSSSTSPLPSL